MTQSRAGQMRAAAEIWELSFVIGLLRSGFPRSPKTQALPLLDGIPLLQGPRGRPRCRPDSMLGDRAYDAELAFAVLCAAAKSCLGSQCAIRSMVAGWGDCAGLWERTFAWLNQFRRLRVRYEKRPDMHLAFLTLACILICWKFLQSFTLGGCPVAHMELLWLPRSPFVDRDNEALKAFRITPRSPTIHNAGARSIQNPGRRSTSMG